MSGAGCIVQTLSSCIHCAVLESGVPASSRLGWHSSRRHDWLRFACHSVACLCRSGAQRSNWQRLWLRVTSGRLPPAASQCLASFTDAQDACLGCNQSSPHCSWSVRDLSALFQSLCVYRSSCGYRVWCGLKCHHGIWPASHAHNTVGPTSV